MKFAIITGLPHSGKSTIARWLHDLEGHVIINTNIIRNSMVGPALDYTQSDIIDSFTRQTALLMARHYLAMGFNVLVDDENPTRLSRTPWYKIAEDFKIPVSVYWVNTPYSICSHVNSLYGELPPAVLIQKLDSYEYPTYRESKEIKWIQVARCRLESDELKFDGRITKS